MAKVGFSGGVESIRGKAGTGIYKKSLGGFSYQQFISPKQKRNVFQLKQRQIMTILNQKWQNLTTAERNSWNITAVFRGKNYTGFYLFILRNTLGYRANEQITLNLAASRVAPTFRVSNIDLKLEGSSVNNEVLFNQNANTNCYVSLYATKILSNGRDAKKYHKYNIFSDFVANGGNKIVLPDGPFEDFYGFYDFQNGDNLCFDFLISDSDGVPNFYQSNIYPRFF